MYSLNWLFLTENIYFNKYLSLVCTFNSIKFCLNLILIFKLVDIEICTKIAISIRIRILVNRFTVAVSKNSVF